MTWAEIQDLAVDSFVCLYCGADAGQECVTKSGRRAADTHGRRTWPIQNAWGAGYQEGEADVLDSAIDSPDRFVRRVERRRQTRAGAAS